MTAPFDRTFRFSASTIAAFLLLGFAAAWSYWTTLGVIVARWDEPQYSHGYLVPVFAAFLLWQRRDRLAGSAFSFNALGLGLIGLALALRLLGTRFSFQYVDQISILPCLAGMVMLVGSWPALSWSIRALAFLGFMIPLPHSVEHALSGPMQSLATTVSTFLLQAIGRPALAEGNVILLNDIELGIVEACSGLRMLVVFFALSTAVAMLISKPLWEKLLIAGSAVPIALASNILRITVTGLFYDTFGNHFGGHLFHDVAGWLMMPLGLAFLGIELWILRTLLIERTTGATPLATESLNGSPVTLYSGKQGSRRKQAAAMQPEPDPEPVAIEATVEA